MYGTRNALKRNIYETQKHRTHEANEFKNSVLKNKTNGLNLSPAKTGLNTSDTDSSHPA